jgi:hypothetical protein
MADGRWPHIDEFGELSKFGQETSSITNNRWLGIDMFWQIFEFRQETSLIIDGR